MSAGVQERFDKRSSCKQPSDLLSSTEHADGTQIQFDHHYKSIGKPTRSGVIILPFEEDSGESSDGAER